MDLFSTIFLNTFVFIFGAAMGSFINVLSDRLPNEESIMGRSHCEDCKHELAWYDLFPLFSFIFLKARCRYCKKNLSFYYPAVEVITGIMFLIAWNFMPLLAPATNVTEFYILKGINLAITSALLVIFFADLKYQIIPDSMHFVLLICAVALKILGETLGLKDILIFLVEGVAVMAPILLLYIATKGRGMGFGDVKLAFVIGVLFGLKLGLIILYLSFVFGAFAGIYLILSKKKKFKSKIAFGPFIVLAMFIALIYKEQILQLFNTLFHVR